MPEREKPRKLEALPPIEYELTPEQAYAIGRGLEQLLEEPFAQIDEALTVMAQEPYVPIQGMQSGVDRMRGLFRKFQTARKVTIVQSYPGWEMRFSEEDEEKPIFVLRRELPIRLVAPLTSALHHETAGPRSGFQMARIINDEFPSNEARNITAQAVRIEELIRPIIGAERLRISSGKHGNARIIPIEPTT